jgi:hypothetical protein
MFNFCVYLTVKPCALKHTDDHFKSSFQTFSSATPRKKLSNFLRLLRSYFSNIQTFFVARNPGGIPFALSIRGQPRPALIRLLDKSSAQEPEALERPGRKANAIHQERAKTAGPPGG